ncbi:MAG: hypothetical protein QXX95_00115 [Nitrososphaerales archaeon]
MFPDLSSYSAIEIPILPYPKEELSKIIKLLKAERPIDRPYVNIEEDVLKKLSLSGLIRIGSKRIFILDKGKRLGSALIPIQKLPSF